MLPGLAAAGTGGLASGKTLTYTLSHTHTHPHTHTHTHAHTHTPKHARTHTRTHTPTHEVFCVHADLQGLREREIDTEVNEQRQARTWERKVGRGGGGGWDAIDQAFRVELLVGKNARGARRQGIQILAAENLRHAGCVDDIGWFVGVRDGHRVLELVHSTVEPGKFVGADVAEINLDDTSRKILHPAHIPVDERASVCVLEGEDDVDRANGLDRRVTSLNGGEEDFVACAGELDAPLCGELQGLTAQETSRPRQGGARTVRETHVV